MIYRQWTGLAVSGQNTAGITEICNNKVRGRYKATNCSTSAHCLLIRERANLNNASFVNFIIKCYYCVTERFIKSFCRSTLNYTNLQNRTERDCPFILRFIESTKFSLLHIKRNKQEYIYEEVAAPPCPSNTPKKPQSGNHSSSGSQICWSYSSALRVDPTSIEILHPCIETTTPLFPLKVNEVTSLSTTGWLRMFPISRNSVLSIILEKWKSCILPREINFSFNKQNISHFSYSSFINTRTVSSLPIRLYV